MTKQESFKRRIRERMEKTGEKYNAARRVLIEKGAKGRKRTWIAEPELAEDTIRTATGRGWEEWCDLIDAWPGHDRGHTAIASYLQEELGVDGWWAQSVTVGYERITGLRLPYQRSDGTFSANKTGTVIVDVDLLRRMLLDDNDRADLFPGMATQLRSRSTSKVLRVAIGPGTALIALDPQPGGKVKVSVAHERIPSLREVEPWKAYWADWIEAIDQS